MAVLHGEVACQTTSFGPLKVRSGAHGALVRIEQITGPPHPPSREWGTDRPGRSFESVGGARHAMEPRVDLHDEAGERFAKYLVRHLTDAAAAGRFERLVLVASPGFLGALRQYLPENLRAKVVGEIDKDLTASPAERLNEALAEVLPL
jgi:protein required for attachment to host cells